MITQIDTQVDGERTVPELVPRNGKHQVWRRRIRIVVAGAVVVLVVVALLRYGPTLAEKARALVPGSPLRNQAVAAPAQGFLPVERGWAACGLNRGMTQWEALQALRALGHPREAFNSARSVRWLFGDRAETYRTGSFLIGVTFETRSKHPRTGKPLPEALEDVPFVEGIQCFRPSRLGPLVTGMTLTDAVAELGKPPAIYYWEDDNPRKRSPEEMVLVYESQGLGVIVEVATNRVIGFAVTAKEE